MRTRFIHVADIHLGYEQYNLVARANDFARAYVGMVDHAISTGVDFVLIAGDLFHRASADAWMLTQATHGLEKLRAAGIPVVAVEGNHDAQHMRKHLSWMEFLADQGLLALLNVQTADNGHVAMVPWDEESRRGSWIDIAGARIYGIKYYGALTSRILESIADAIEPGPGEYTILMLHAGIQGQVPHLHGGLTPHQLAPLHPPVDYLALGHVHKRLEMDGWIFNPGSTEINSMEEIDWEHGFFAVEVDTEATPIHRVTAVRSPDLRPFHRISVSADGASSIEEFVARVEERIAAAPPVADKAVIELHLGGVAEFKRQDVPLERLRGAAELHFDPLIVRIRSSLAPPGLVSVKHGERLRRADLERQVVEQLVYQEGAYRDRASAWTTLILDIKNMAVEKNSAGTIVDHLRSELARMGDDPAAGTPESGGPEEVVASEADEAAPSEHVEAADVLAMGGEPPCMANLFEDW